jgi:tryptophan-rich sensory protein
MALLVLFLLILSTSLLIKQVKQIDKTAALLLTPYLVWLVFAGVLNYAIAMLN